MTMTNHRMSLFINIICKNVPRMSEAGPYAAFRPLLPQMTDVIVWLICYDGEGAGHERELWVNWPHRLLQSMRQKLSGNVMDRVQDVVSTFTSMHEVKDILVKAPNVVLRSAAPIVLHIASHGVSEYPGNLVGRRTEVDDSVSAWTVLTSWLNSQSYTNRVRHVDLGACHTKAVARSWSSERPAVTGLAGDATWPASAETCVNVMVRVVSRILGELDASRAAQRRDERVKRRKT